MNLAIIFSTLQLIGGAFMVMSYIPMVKRYAISQSLNLLFGVIVLTQLLIYRKNK